MRGKNTLSSTISVTATAPATATPAMAPGVAHDVLGGAGAGTPATKRVFTSPSLDEDGIPGTDRSLDPFAFPF